MQKIRVFSIACFAAALFAALAAPAAEAKGDAAKGKIKSAVCAACHGPAGVSVSPQWPNLAGQKEAYLIKQMKDFKSGARKEPTMLPFITPLSDEDIKNLAAYYSGLKCGK